MYFIRNRIKKFPEFIYREKYFLIENLITEIKRRRYLLSLDLVVKTTLVFRLL